MSAPRLRRGVFIYICCVADIGGYSIHFVDFRVNCRVFCGGSGCY
jgi:hypothetical protein